MTGPTTDGPSRPDWAALRADFPTTDNLTYLDMARKAILPRVVGESMDDARSAAIVDRFLADLEREGANR